MIIKHAPDSLKERSADGISPLMLLALSPHLHYDETLLNDNGTLQDPYGNTLDRLRAVITPSHSFGANSEQINILNFLSGIFNAQKLDQDLWKTIKNHSYVQVLSYHYSRSWYTNIALFDLASLYTVLSQKTQTSIQRSFLQQSPEDFTNRNQANQLWRGLFAEADKEIMQEHRNTMPNAIRALQSAKATTEIIEMEAATEDSRAQTLRTLQSNLLSTGGTFGVNFNRSANEDEKQIMIQSLESFRNRTQDPQEIIDSLIIPYSSQLTPTQQARLNDHQINCAVIALRYVLDFDEINARLAAKLPSHVEPIDSEHRYEEITGYRAGYHRSPSPDLTGGLFPQSDY